MLPDWKQQIFAAGFAVQESALDELKGFLDRARMNRGSVWSHAAATSAWRQPAKDSRCASSGASAGASLLARKVRSRIRGASRAVGGSIN